MMGNRYTKKPRQKDEGEKPFWISFADLMTALMTLFLVVMAVSLMVVTKEINAATQAEEGRQLEILDICQSIENDPALKNQPITVDCKENRINFDTYFVYEVTCRATSPNGRYIEACASCASNEKEFSHKENDVRATAQTRASNRSISDCSVPQREPQQYLLRLRLSAYGQQSNRRPQYRRQP